MTAAFYVSLGGVSSHKPGRDILIVSFRQEANMVRAGPNPVESIHKSSNFHTSEEPISLEPQEKLGSSSFLTAPQT